MTTPGELILEQTLGDYYRAKVMLKGNPGEVVAALKQRASQLQGLPELMKKRLAELEALENVSGGDLTQRCVISSHQLACLRQALS